MNLTTQKHQRSSNGKREMEGFLVEMCWSLILIGMCSLVIGVCDVMWVKPKRIRSALWRQGVRGPRPSFLYGNIPEMQKMERSVLIMKEEAPPSGQHHVSHNWADSIFPYLQRWTQQYGGVYMYSTGNRQHLYVNKPELVKELNMHKSLDLGKNRYLVEALEPMLGDGIIKANGQHWAHQRKLIAPEFFLDKVKGMVGLMEESAIIMMREWESRIRESEGGVADTRIDEDLRSFSADVISRACFGSSYSKGKHIFAKLRNIQEAMSSKPGLLFGLPNFRYLPTKNNRDIWRLKKEIEALILEVVKDRREESQKGGKSEKDLLQMILEGAAANSDEPQPDEHKINRFIVDNCKNIYFAGHETTAIAASWCLMLLALHPEWQQRARAEILEVCGNHHHHQLPDLDTLRKLKTLTMVIQETLRLYGPAVMLSREAFADIKLGDFVVPKGINIWTLIPSLHRDPEIWGPDPNVFKPERFAGGISEACKYPQAYIPFGYGTRLCLGQTFAMIELKILLCLILSKFSFSLSSQYRHSPVFRMLLVPEYGVKLLIKRV